MNWETLRHHALVIAAYAVLALLMTMPVVLHLTDEIAGQGGDPWQTMWRFEFTERGLVTATTSGNLPAFIQQEFLGGGEPRLVNLSVWPYLPLHALLGQPLTYNVVWLLSFILSGYFMYLLSSYLIQIHYPLQPTPYNLRSHFPSFLAGLVYMFLPYHVAHAAGHFGAMQTQWLPLIMLAWLYFLQKPRPASALALAATLTIQAWTEHHYALWAVVAILIYAGTHAADIHKQWQLPTTRRAFILLTALLLLFVVIPYLPTIRQASTEPEALALGETQAIRFSADPFAYIIPSASHPLWGDVANRLFAADFTGNPAEATQFLGFIPLLLIIFFHQRIPASQKKYWLTLAGIFFVISLGPALHLFGRVTSIPLPYAVLDALPVFDAIRTVARSGVMVGLAVAILVGWVLRTQVKWVPGFAALAAGILFEFFFFPAPLQSAQLPAVYGALKNVSGQSLLELPAATNYAAASRSLYASLDHGKTVLGNIALERGRALDDISRSVPALRQVLYLRSTHVREARDEFFAQALPDTFLDAADWLDIGAIIVHTDSLSPTQLTATRQFLEGELQFVPEDFDDTILYRIPRILNGDKIILMRQDGWENIGLDQSRQSVFADIPRTATATLINLRPEPVQVDITFSFAPESHTALSILYGGHVVLDLSDSIPASPVTARLTVPSGESELVFRNKLPAKIIIQNPKINTTPALP